MVQARRMVAELCGREGNLDGGAVGASRKGLIPSCRATATYGMPLYATNTDPEVTLKFRLRNPISELADGERHCNRLHFEADEWAGMTSEPLARHTVLVDDEIPVAAFRST